MARKINIKDIRKPKTAVVGAGITEYWYLRHLKKKMGYQYELKPSLFGDESMNTIRKRISEELETGGSVVCIFDEDVRQWNDSEKKRMDEIHRLYDNHPQIVIASSMPSIEYWLLLHFENTNRYFGTSRKVIEVLRNYLHGFDKHEQYLKQEKWFMKLIGGNNMQSAYLRARQSEKSGASYSNMWRAIDKFNEH
ncbi:MAG: RloB family protein [Muribaculaceae bacterium]|nr:RloB family protein [Muribaculaceae bacterium]